MPTTCALEKGTKIVVAFPGDKSDVILEGEFQLAEDRGCHVIVTILVDGKTRKFLALVDGQVPNGPTYYQLYRQEGDQLVAHAFIDD